MMEGNMIKKLKVVKSFTVDESDYVALSKIFKKSGTDVSLSLFVNKCLKELNIFLGVIEDYRRAGDQFTVPMSYVIKSIVESDDIMGFYRNWPEENMAIITKLLEWQSDYEADQKNIPRDSYPFVKSGLFTLAPNKKYIIDKKTGIKYITAGRGSIVKLDNVKEVGKK
jgi:hypothetical protein